MTQRIVFGCGRRQKQKTSSSAINSQLILFQSNKSGERRKITIQRAQSGFATAFSVNKSRESGFCGSKSLFRVRSRTKVVATGLFATFSPLPLVQSTSCGQWNAVFGFLCSNRFLIDFWVEGRELKHRPEPSLRNSFLTALNGSPTCHHWHLQLIDGIVSSENRFYTSVGRACLKKFVTKRSLTV